MLRAVIVVGATDRVRRELEKHVGTRSRLLVVRLAQQGRFRLEPRPQDAVQMLEAAADSTGDPSAVLIIILPYAPCVEPLTGTVVALEELGAAVLRPQPGAGRWPSRPPALDNQFQLALRDALQAAIDSWLPGEPVPESVEAAVARARTDFADALHIPENLTIDTDLDGAFWYGVLRALQELCKIERKGEAANKRDTLRDLLSTYVRVPKRTYKIGDTGVFANDPTTGETIHLRERVHIVEGKPQETESVYWATIGSDQSSYRYLIGRIGRHA